MTSRASLDTLRASLRPLLDERSPADALASYYALHHPPDRTELFVHHDDAGAAEATHRASPPGGETGPVIGFLVRARTGLDLFRPLVTFRADSDAAARSLFRDGLVAGRPAYLTVPAKLGQWASRYLKVTDAELHRLYRLNPQRYQPQINVLVVSSASPDGLPRCEIRSGEKASAVAGVNWQSPAFAEVYVYTDPAVRGRGWGRAVVEALSGLILGTGRMPLYVVAESNTYSIRLAEAVGFEDTGFREYVGQAVRNG